MAKKLMRILEGRECTELLRDFREAYRRFAGSFIELGRKATIIREQEAWGEDCKNLDDWIRSEGYERSIIYGCMKAARIFQLTALAAEPLKIVLDRESHFREFPADADARQAKAIVERLAVTVEPQADGSRHPTAKQIKAAVDEVVGTKAERAEFRKATTPKKFNATDRTDTTDRPDASPAAAQGPGAMPPVPADAMAVLEAGYSLTQVCARIEMLVGILVERGHWLTSAQARHLMGRLYAAADKIDALNLAPPDAPAARGQRSAIPADVIPLNARRAK